MPLQGYCASTLMRAGGWDKTALTEPALSPENCLHLAIGTGENAARAPSLLHALLGCFLRNTTRLILHVKA